MQASTNWYQIIALYLAGALAAFQYAKMPWMLKDLLVQAEFSGFQQAILLSTIGIIGALFGTFAGALCQRIGLRRSLIAGLAIAIIGALLPLISANYFPLLIARVVESTAHMAIVVTAPTLMLMLAAPQDRARIMAFWSCYFTLTFMSVASIAPTLIAFAGWQSFPVLHALLLALALGGIMQFISEQNAQPSQPNTTPPAANALLGAQWRLLSHRRLLIIPLTFIGYTLLFVSLVSLLPKMLSAVTETQYRLGFWLPGCALVGTLIALFTLKRGIKPWKLVRVAIAVITLAALALLLMSDDVNARIVITMVIFLMLGLLPAGIIGSLPDVLEANDPDIPLVNGGLVQFGNLGNFIGPPVLTLLIGSLGWAGVSLYLLLGAGIVSVCLVLLSRLVQQRA
ncbi:MFS transporter [Leucothrix mucor]|uniref:MFS transporter n=1 Tax=Leucothrix mucor TaxID=45248 RepID=UPI0003B597E7|nr:MFS transporter [Leucothrix mucor]